MRSIYKAYDIRGRVPEELDPAKAVRIAASFASFLKVRTVVLGRDVRVSSEALAASAREGLTRMGCEVIDIGLSTTPMLYFATASLRADAGLMVTASHNPPHDNGFKMCRAQAAPVSYDDGIRPISEMAEAGGPSAAAAAGKVRTVDIQEAYRVHVRSFAGALLGHARAPMRVVLDGGNGMAGAAIPTALRDLPIEIIPLYLEPDGRFPNHPPNPLVEANLRDLRDTVVREGALVGIAYDGDADRCVFIDEQGGVLGSDLATALLARAFLASAPGGTVVYDLRSSRVVAEEIQKAGGIPVRERVGHSFIKATMRRLNAVFAGELSGHFYFRDNFFCDSALVATVSFLGLLARSGEPLSRLAGPLRRTFQTGEVNFRVADPDATLRRAAERFADGKADWLDGLTVAYGRWWFNLRKSNTEPLVRLNLEADDRPTLDASRARLGEMLGTPIAG
ncbi:MAG: phosphomannomutase/phosphoglucomutase [Planctomycetes bacterium]|nr:phosphomannomutase/phosphoglucomutase [Planctomycetota bacterium]